MRSSTLREPWFEPRPTAVETVAVWPIVLPSRDGGWGSPSRTAEGGFLVRATVPVHRPGGPGSQGLHETEVT